MSGNSKIPKQDRLWADCSEKEARITTKMGIPVMRIRHLQLVPDVIKEIRGSIGNTSLEEIVMNEDMIA